MLPERKITTLRLSLALIKQLGDFAHKNGISRTAVIELAVREFIARKEREAKA